MQEMVGRKFGKWVVLTYEGKFNRVHKFKVLCECGNESVSDYIALTRGKSTKCRSCARKISTSGIKNPAHTHGYSSVSHPYFKIYTSWCSMKDRCYCISDTNYKRYGLIGIKVCDLWRNSFEVFLEDMGIPPDGHSLDRIDVLGDYTKENCRWADQDTQSNNQRKTVYYEYNNEKFSESQWARKLGITRNKLMSWARKKGIEWVVKNIEAIKKAYRGMSNDKYIELGLDIPNRLRKAKDKKDPK